MQDQLGVVAKYCRIDTKILMTMTEAELLSRELADRTRSYISSDLDQGQGQVTVVGVANGGLMVARIVADSLSTPLEVIKIRRSGSTLKRSIRSKALVSLTTKALTFPVISPILRRIIDSMNKLQTVNEKVESGFNVKGKNVVLVDDCIESGKTIELAKKILTEAGAKSVQTSVISLSALKDHHSIVTRLAPLIFLNKRIQHYPWSQNNPAYDEFIAWINSRGIKLWL